MTATFRFLQGMALVVVVAFLLAHTATALAGDNPMPDPQELKIHRFFERIKVVSHEGTATDIRSLIKDIEAEWPEKKDAGYFRVILELCTTLNSINSGDVMRSETVRQLATMILDAPGDKPIDAEVKMLLFLQSDPDYTRGSLRGEAWRAERPIRAQRWLAVWHHLLAEKAGAANAGGEVELNVQPPPETGLPRGVSPSAIKDPVLRKKYEDAIARNAAIARANRRKSDLENLEALLKTPAKRYLIDAYSKPPFQTDELEKSLAETGLDKEMCAVIVEEVKKRVAAKIEEEAKLSQFPSGTVIKEPSPPGTGPHHADPRLAVKLSFDQKSPLVEDTLRELRKSTSVDLTRADEIQNQHPAVGSFSFRNSPAWRVMDDLAASKRVEGRWEKEGDGYRLVSNGNPVHLPEDTGGGPTTAPGSDLGPRLFLTAAIVVVLLVASGAILWFRFSRKKPTPPPTRG